MKVAGIYRTNRNKSNFAEFGSTPEIADYVDWPLGLQSILAVAQQEGHKVDLFLPKNEKEIEEVLAFNPDLVLYSCMTNQVDYARRFNNSLKSRKPKIISVIGGYPPSAMPEVVKEGFDFAVLGEGERTIKELLEKIVSGKENFSDIKGIAFLKNGELLITPKRERIENLDDLPAPFINSRLLSQKSNYLGFPARRERISGYIEFSRGCTFNCKFCCSPNLLGRKIVYKNPERVASQLKEMYEQYGLNDLFLADLNPTLNPERLEKLAEELEKEGINKHERWGFESGFKRITIPLLEKAYKAGNNYICWAVENINEQNWVQNETSKLPSFEVMKNILDCSAANKIMNEAFYIIGWPDETKGDLEKAMQILPTLNLNRIRPTIYTPMPGSVSFDEMEKTGSLTKTDWDKYDTQHLVFRHKHFAPGELEEKREEILKIFYGSKDYRARTRYFCDANPEYK